MKTTEQHPTQLHDHIKIELAKMLAKPENQLPSGRTLIHLTDFSSVTQQDDDHARFQWILTENIHEGDDEDLAYDMVSELIADFIDNTVEHATKVINNSWVKLEAEPSPVTFITNSAGDSLMINPTDKRTIITLIYSGMY